MKSTYLDTLNKADRAIEKSRLKRASDFESLVSKDLSEFTLDEAKSMISFCNFSSAPSAMLYVQTFRSYTNWCIATGKYAGPNVYEQINIAMVEQCISTFKRKSKYIEEDVVLSLVKQLENAIDKAIILGIYNGLLGENMREISLLRREHINTEDCSIKVPIDLKQGEIITGREIILPKEVITVLLEAMDQTFYVNARKRNIELTGLGIVKEAIRKWEPPKTDLEVLIRYRRRIIDRLKKFSDLYDIPNLSAQNLWFSGVINSIKKTAQKEDIAYLEVVGKEIYFNPIRLQYGITTTGSAFINRYKDYLI